MLPSSSGACNVSIMRAGRAEIEVGFAPLREGMGAVLHAVVHTAVVADIAIWASLWLRDAWGDCCPARNVPSDWGALTGESKGLLLVESSQDGSGLDIVASCTVGRHEWS